MKGYKAYYVLYLKNFVFDYFFTVISTQFWLYYVLSKYYKTINNIDTLGTY